MNTICNLLRKNLDKALWLLVFAGFTGAVQAQEFLTGLKTNTAIIKEVQKFEIHSKTKSRTENTPVLLPFFEDFSNYKGYPDENLFVDRQAFVNPTFPVFAPTIGVVTLDALNEKGEIYAHLNVTSKGADTLTSRFIRLDSLWTAGVFRSIRLEDSLYFSFYFQPGGAGLVGAGAWELVGNQPGAFDSLVLEFGYTEPFEDTVKTYWNHVWSSAGLNVKEWISENPLQFFKQVMIPITDEKYLSHTFQFRFRNYASLEPQQGIFGWEGNVDQWHIDYIRLDVNRNQNDIYTNDLAFAAPTTSFLKNYYAMPWKQFQPSDLKPNFTNTLTNLFVGTLGSEYWYFITQNGNLLGSYYSESENIEPYSVNGFYQNPSHTNPAISFNNPLALTDTTTIKVTHIFQNSGGVAQDFRLANDTCVFEQKFYNYYAYDDGTAEYGYVLNNQFNIAYLAMKFSLRVSDQMSAMRMWFNQTKNAENENAAFYLMVWKDDNGKPGEVLYTSEVKHPTFANQFLDFVEYQFDKKIPVSGTIWIGFQQEGNVQLNIGFDQNTNSGDFFKYNTQGTWENSAYKGTPMMRPVFGEINLSIDDNEPQQTTLLRPNPARDWVEVTIYDLQITRVEIFDVMGRNVGTKLPSNELEGWQAKPNGVVLNISHLIPGIYFVRIYKENNRFETHKLIKN